MNAHASEAARGVKQSAHLVDAALVNLYGQ
jgi:hypothetical protein